VVAEDDAAKPKQGTAAAQKLCDARSPVWWATNSAQRFPRCVYNQCGIRIPSATNPKLTTQGFKTTFRLLANDNALGAGLALHAANNLKLKKIAIIDDRTAYGQGVAEVFTATAKSKGIEIVDQQYTTDKATDFMAILTAIKSKNPDGVFFGGMDPQAGPMRQMEQLANQRHTSAATASAPTS
jgi:branched-chain amino acid transport system substrate-binding protein